MDNRLHPFFVLLDRTLPVCNLTYASGLVLLLASHPPPFICDFAMPLWCFHCGYEVLFIDTAYIM